MNNRQVLIFVEDWLERKRIKSYFKDKKNKKQTYIKIKEDDLYILCYKLVNLINNNIE